MTIDRDTLYKISLIRELVKLPNELEWIEFKHNYENPDEIGEYISALANSAAINEKTHAYIVWGVDDASHRIVGTSFSPGTAKKGNEELESWLLRLLEPKIHFRFDELRIDGNTVVLLEIDRAYRHPVKFKGNEFIRVGSYKKNLKDFPEKERLLWRIFDQTPFERMIAAEKVSSDAVLQLIDYPSYFELLGIPLPDTRERIFEALTADGIISRSVDNAWNISNLGAVLFAKRLSDFANISRKALRVIVYNGVGRTDTIREQDGIKGYASGFEGLIGFINTLLPANEVIANAIRKNVPMYPEIAVRELVANAIIHQDFDIRGAGPMVEIFDNRMEITNPGKPLIDTSRFLDTPPRSRNEGIASFMRRVGVCEERGSGVDKVVFQTEMYQLPAPQFETVDDNTRAILFAHKPFRTMDRDERVRACYLHSCLKYVSHEFMTNTSLRERFNIEQHNSADASRIIREALKENMIKPYDDGASKKYMKYKPYWA